MQAKPQQEHHWLQKLVGEWTSEMEAVMGPDKPPETVRGTESIRSIGGIWTIGEGRSEMPGGGTGTTMIMTLGYDPAKKKYVGTFIGSMMHKMWIYEGELDAAGTKLILDTEGPDFAVEGKTTQYKDEVEFQDDDHRTLSSQMLMDDGTWVRFMTAHYRRVK